ncbi:DnaA N-terminal domain-containing protein [Anaeromyxobacter oryzisoli]|uniref:DnaA N-terminal domain-containing protein n=1 Tax=Anaeromyxobacter oryzisoli TaxID=2925408 RepID=UPI001F5961CC|nr:DnaA N-terminal domain-containing protein [Anaeromyxobacter sp. SG63]
MASGAREVGWVKLWRRLRSSPLWRSLRADQKGVLATLLLLANWKPGQARWHGRPYEVARGELAHSLEEIAEEAGCTVKVVRTTLVALMADDSEFGGNGAFITERYPISGTGPGTGPRVLRIEKYEDFQGGTTETGTESGTDQARPGHGSGTGRAEREEDQEGKELEEGGPGGARDPWGEVLRALEARMRPDLFARWFAPLRGHGHVAGGLLLVEAPDRFHRDFLEDQYAAILADLLVELRLSLQLQFTTAARRAAGGAS